jgi:hypothetical protein
MSSSIVVRVAVNNNFNCTVAEFAQLDELAKLHPHSVFFLNSNIKTPNLLKVNDHPYQVVVTLNPDVDIKDNLVQRLYHIASDNVAFVRIKYVPHHPEIIDLIHKVSESFPVVITLQRFNGKKSISTIVPDYPNHYMFSHNRYRLFGDSLKEVESLVKPDNNIHICDQLGLGCGGCGLCSTLTTGESYPIYTLNLASSGICPYSCLDCYAKTMQHFLKCINMPVIHYDWIHRNHKQTGRTQHIRDKKKAAA